MTDTTAFTPTLDSRHITQNAKEPKPSAKLRMPNLFIVGASKSGSTTLWHMLKQHPKVFMPEEELYKEPNFFSPGANMAKYDLGNYLELYRDATDKHRYIGEASTVYLTDPQSAGLIHTCSPEAKIIMILRNPVERAYSLYNWMRQEGYEWASTFEEALKLETWREQKSLPNILHPCHKYNYQYYQSGCYAKQVKRYLDLFGKNVLILVFKDLKEKPEETMDKLYSFLELEKNEVENEIKNPSYVIRSGKLQFLLRYASLSKFIFDKRVRGKKEFTKDGRDKLLNIGIVKQRPRKLSETTHKRLLTAYKTDIMALQQLTGIDLSAWLKPLKNKVADRAQV